MPVTLIRVGTSQQTAGAAQRSGTFLVLGPDSCQETFRATRTKRRDESHETHQPILDFMIHQDRSCCYSRTSLPCCTHGDREFVIVRHRAGLLLSGFSSLFELAFRGRFAPATARLS
jgi:hypothetical protein